MSVDTHLKGKNLSPYRVVREAGLECAHVDLARPLDGAAFSELSAARWQAEGARA